MQKNKNIKNNKLTNFLRNNQVCILKKVSKKFDTNNDRNRAIKENKYYKKEAIPKYEIKIIRSRK
jgi:hypothetical protein